MYSVTRTVTGGTSNTWRELTPAAAPSASPAPQSAQVSGNTCTVSSGLSTRGNPAPAAPGCLPRRRSDRLPVFRDGALRPGKSSVDGGIEELSLIHISEPTRLGMISYAV